jgi:hypothetical protein
MSPTLEALYLLVALPLGLSVAYAGMLLLAILIRK